MMMLSLMSCDNTPLEVTLTNLEEDEARLAGLYEEVELLIADKSCTRNGQCKVMAYGDKACGGPVGYLVYSSGNVDEHELEALVEELTTLQGLMNEAYGYFSDCSIPSPPDVSCLDGNCE